jgi:hypothetical protein
MTRRMRMESSVAPRAESTAPWLFIVRRFMGRAPRRNRAILAERLIHFLRFSRAVRVCLDLSSN